MVRAPATFVLLQFPLALCVVVAGMFYPTADSVAVLVAPGKGSAIPAIEWARANDAPILGMAIGGASPVVRMSGSASAISAMAAGFIPVAVDLATCGTSPQAKGFRQ